MEATPKRPGILATGEEAKALLEVPTAQTIRKGTVHHSQSLLNLAFAVCFEHPQEKLADLAETAECIAIVEVGSQSATAPSLR